MVLNLKVVASTLGALLFFLGVSLLVPMGVAVGYGERSWWGFGLTALLSLAVGAGAWYKLGGPMQRDADLRLREGFAIVSMSWLVLSLVGALPYVFTGVLDSYTDAFFETMSGFTTTGATILGGAYTPEIEAMPHGFLFWRSLTHWLGGMGIIVLTLAIMPILGVAGMQLFKAEVPGPSSDKLTPRVQETAKNLWFIYVGFTIIEIVLLAPATGLFDAVNHAFATMATGGFSTLNGSVADYDSAYIDWVITVFMFLAGMNFALHYRLLRGRAIILFRDTEFKVYAAIVLAASLSVTFGVWRPSVRILARAEDVAVAFEGYSSFLDALRYGAFQAVSIITTTGFGSADYEIWGPLAVGTLFILFFVGGMAGSTGGGVKVVRHVLFVKNSYKEINQLVHPQAVIPIRLNGRVVPQEVMREVLSFFALYFGLIAFGTAVMALIGLDLLSALGATISCLGNIGPAFGSFGPTENYAHVPMLGKWILALLMMAGRLEIFTVLILFVPAFWRR